MFQQNFKKKVSRVFQECFNEVLILRFGCCMDLIAATRAEGGLVLEGLATKNKIQNSELFYLKGICKWS